MWKRIAIIFSALFVFLIVLAVGFRIYTKSFSPEDTATFERNSLQLAVHYSRPYKRRREIFGDLIPYGKIWRTGANEATEFHTNHKLLISGQELPAGTYSLWTLPEPDSWVIIFNRVVPPWGVDFNGDVNYEQQNDALRVEVPVINSNKEFEQFTIGFEEIKDEIELIMVWDHTMVALPFVLAEE